MGEVGAGQVRLGAPPPAVALLVALLVGGATSPLQTLLPHVVAPLANSAGPWCLVAWWAARGAGGSGRAALVATSALLALVAGYYLVAALRGFGLPVPWVAVWAVVALVAGPPLGAAAARAAGPPGPLRVVAGLLLPALLAAEAAYGLTVVGATTSHAWWVAEACLALVLAARAVRSTAPDARPRSRLGHCSLSAKCVLRRNT